MKPRTMTLIAASALVLMIPLAAHAATSLFTDVSDSSIFVDDINWMKTAGITNGCNSAGTEYCPEENVTRQQMAAFMHRLATKRVVDAGTLDGKDSKDFVFNTGWESKTFNFANVTAGNQVTLDTKCPLNKYVISGGGQSTYKQLVMATSQPLDDLTWRVTWTNTGSTTINPTLTVWAMCAGTGVTAIPLS
jgi:hypothetical protein